MGDNQPINDKKKQVIVQGSYLSDDLIIHEILTRLPVKSILQFKSVSKLWYSTLSSSKFASFHLTKSPFSHPCAPVNTLFIKSWKDCYLFSYNDQNSGNLEDTLVKLDDVNFGVRDYLVVTGCCNGLICLSRLSGEYFLLWNPATRKQLKYDSDGYLKRLNGHNYHYIAHGFGCTSSDDDYKYVRILPLNNYLETKQQSYIVHVFSLRENKWREIEFDNGDIVILYRQAVLVDEKLYWAGHLNLIVCFDLGLEKFDIIKLNGADFADIRVMGVMGGFLSRFNYNRTSTGDDDELIIQIMESTTIQKSIVLPKEIILDVREIIGYTRTGNFFVTGKSSDGVEVTQGCHTTSLWLVEPGMKLVQCKKLLKFKAPLYIVKYVPSLVSPFPIEELSSEQ